jgi:hypothetical protein
LALLTPLSLSLQITELQISNPMFLTDSLLHKPFRVSLGKQSRYITIAFSSHNLLDLFSWIVKFLTNPPKEDQRDETYLRKDKRPD